MSRSAEEISLGELLMTMQDHVATQWNEIHTRLNRLRVEGSISVEANFDEDGEHRELFWSHDQGKRTLIVRRSTSPPIKGTCGRGTCINLCELKLELQIKMLKFAPALIEAVIAEGKNQLAEGRRLLELIHPTAEPIERTDI